MTSLPCWPTRRAEGSLKEAGAGEAVVGADVAVPASAPAGEGVAGGLAVAAEVGLCCGAAGGAGVDVEAEGVDGVAVLGGAGAAFGCEIAMSTESSPDLLKAYLGDHTNYETLLFNVVGFHGICVHQNLACVPIISRPS